MFCKLGARIWYLWLVWISIADGHWGVCCAKWSNWTSWSACCINKQSRYRTCLRSNFDGTGTQCAGNDRIFRHCWGCPNETLSVKLTPWTMCSTTCGEGLRSRTVYCDLTYEQVNHYKCRGETAYVVGCKMKQCTVDGNWSIWSPWEVCTAACGKMGLTNRSRACVDPVPQNGGKMCSGSHFESKLCISTSCPDTTPKNRLVTEIPVAYDEHHGGTDDSQSSQIESFLSKHSLLMASIIGSVGFILSVFIVTAFIYRYLEKKRLRTTPYRMKKVRFEGDIRTVVLYPNSKNPMEST